MFCGKTRWMVLSVLLAALLALFGCEGDDGERGPQGPPGPPGDAAGGTVSGQVINQLTGLPVAGVEVRTEPDLEGTPVETDAEGMYTAQLPVGSYTLTYVKTPFEEVERRITMVAGQEVQTDVSLMPMAPIVLGAGEDETAAPGETVDLRAEVEVLDGSPGTPTYLWRQVSGPPASISGADTAAPTVNLPGADAFRDALFSHVEPLERFMVQGVSPLSLEEAGASVFEVAATVDGATVTDTVAIHADLPFVSSSGLRAVPTGSPVILHGKTQEAYQWGGTAPDGTAVAFDDPAIQNPSFTPALVGEYTIMEGVSGTEMNVYGGTWVGVITGQDADGRPVSDPTCLACHREGGNAPDLFTPWSRTGHAEILKTNLNTSTHYRTSCFPCHSVGYDTDTANNGFDDQPDFQAFLDAGLLNNPGDNWTTMLQQFPASARMANVQCENCHGPQNTQGAHAKGDLRKSLSSDVCGVCHGEPPRHARFQQWEGSGHGNFHLALEEGTRGSCAPCHSGNGFVQWGDLGFGKDTSAVEGFAPEEIHPVTCTACHDPHRQGRTSGEPNTATVRLTDTTPELKAGFIATGVGRGALCMLCHNSRRAPYSTTLYGENYFNGETDMEDRSTHPGPQADILMGENGFFVTPGARGSHSYISDTCTNCHMVLTPPPEELSYYGGGTNHTFEASRAICSECHGAFDGGTLGETVTALLEDLEGLIVAALTSDIQRIAATEGVSGLLLDYDTDENAYGGMVTASGAPESTIASVAAQAGFPHGYDITLGDGRTVSTAHQDIVLWRDGNGDGTVDADEVGTGDTIGQGIVDTTIGGIPTNGQTIVKAKWNHDLVHADGSHGVHNPSFVRNILTESIARLR